MVDNNDNMTYVFKGQEYPVIIRGSGKTVADLLGKISHKIVRYPEDDIEVKYKGNVVDESLLDQVCN